MVTRYVEDLPGHTAYLAERNFPHLVETFDSLNEFVSEAQRLHGPGTYIYSHTVANARDGIKHDKVPSILDIASESIMASPELRNVMTFTAEFDVAGDYVDMGRYVTGEPECMVYSPLQTRETVSPIITLVSSADCNFGGDWETRGIVATALALALSRLGYATEMWADNYGEYHGVYQYQRIRVKATDDELNPARLMFGFGDSAMLEQLAFGCYDGFRTLGYSQFDGFRTTRGSARWRSDAIRALYPEGAIFITGNLSAGATPQMMAAAVVKELKGAKLIA